MAPYKQKLRHRTTRNYSIVQAEIMALYNQKLRHCTSRNYDVVQAEITALYKQKLRHCTSRNYGIVQAEITAPYKQKLWQCTSRNYCNLICASEETVQLVHNLLCCCMFCLCYKTQNKSSFLSNCFGVFIHCGFLAFCSIAPNAMHPTAILSDRPSFFLVCWCIFFHIYPPIHTVVVVST